MAGGWAGSTRRYRLPDNWFSEIRPFILRRDGHICQWLIAPGVICGAPANQVDHIIPGDDHGPKNLQSLCQPHHDLKSAGEGGRAGPRMKRPPERHPGLR